MRRSPLRGHRLFRSESNILLLHLRRGAGNLDRAGSRGFNSSAGQVFRRRESPCAIDNHTYAHSNRLSIGRAANLAVLRGKRAPSLADDAHIDVARAAYRGHIQNPAGNLLHRGNLNLPRRHPSASLRTGFATEKGEESTVWRAPHPALSSPRAVPSTLHAAWWIQVHWLHRISLPLDCREPPGRRHRHRPQPPRAPIRG